MYLFFYKGKKVKTFAVSEYIDGAQFKHLDSIFLRRVKIISYLDIIIWIFRVMHAKLAPNPTV